MWPLTPAGRQHLACRCRTCCLRADENPRPLRCLIFRGSIPTPCNRCVRFATTVASGHATLATKRTLLLTWAGLPPAGSHQLCLAHVAVGTCISWHAPRPDPYVRLSRIRLVWGFPCQGCITPLFVMLLLVWGFPCQGCITPLFVMLLLHLLFDPRRKHSSVATAYYHRRRAQRWSRTALFQRRRRLVLNQR